MSDAGRAWHGIGWPLVRLDDGASSHRLDALVREGLELDPRGVDEAWGREPITHRPTIVRGIERRPPTPAPTRGALERGEALARAVESIARAEPDAALALGGGLDALAVLCTWRAVMGRWPAVVTVRTGIPEYDEVEVVRSRCDGLGIPLDVIDLPPPRSQALLAPAVLAAQTPLHGWHPVTRLGLARALRARGHRALITGDGADAIFRGRPDYDYVPLVATLSEAAGLQVCSPFWDEEVVAAVLAAGPDPHKRWLREQLEALHAPGPLDRPKLSRHLELPAPLPAGSRALERTAARLGRPLRLDTARERLQWHTLHTLLTSLEERAA